MIKLSIIMGVHNQEELAINALKHMPVRNDVEVLVIDNASTDGSLAAVRKYKEEHPELNLTIFTNKRMVNPCVNGNRLIELSHGEYFHLHCDDDYINNPIKFGGNDVVIIAM